MHKDYDSLNPWQTPDPELVQNIIAGNYLEDVPETHRPGDEYLLSVAELNISGPLTDLEWRMVMGMAVEDYTKLWRADQIKRRTAEDQRQTMARLVAKTLVQSKAPATDQRRQAAESYISKNPPKRKKRQRRTPEVISIDELVEVLGNRRSRSEETTT